MPKLRKYERRSRVTTRQVVEKLDRVDEAVAELRKRESAASSRASGQSKLATWDRLLRKLGYSGTYLSVDILEMAAGRVPKHQLLRQIGCSKAPRLARPRVMGDGVEDEGNWPLSKQRTGTSAAD